MRARMEKPTVSGDRVAQQPTERPSSAVADRDAFEWRVVSQDPSTMMEHVPATRDMLLPRGQRELPAQGAPIDRHLMRVIGHGAGLTAVAYGRVVLSGYGGRLNVLGGFFLSSSITYAIARSSWGSCPAMTSFGVCSTAISGATPSFSTM